MPQTTKKLHVCWKTPLNLIHLLKDTATSIVINLIAELIKNDNYFPTALSSSTVPSSPSKTIARPGGSANSSRRPAPCSSLVGPLSQLQSIPQPARRKDLAFLGFLCALHGAVPREVRTYGFGGMALEAVVLSQSQQQGSSRRFGWGVAPWQEGLGMTSFWERRGRWN